MAKNEGVPDIDRDEQDIDTCGCDVELHDSEATPDAELPAAAGGMEAAHEKHADEDGIDGCDVDFEDIDATKDEELPVGVGGSA